MSLTDAQFSQSGFSNSRILSAFELLLGAFIVIGHNVFRVVPNEVPILFVLGMVSIRWRNGGWSAMGLKRPASWNRILLIALAAAVLRIVLATWLSNLSPRISGLQLSPQPERMR